MTISTPCPLTTASPAHRRAIDERRADDTDRDDRELVPVEEGDAEERRRDLVEQWRPDHEQDGHEQEPVDRGSVPGRPPGCRRVGRGTFGHGHSPRTDRRLRSPSACTSCCDRSGSAEKPPNGARACRGSVVHRCEPRVPERVSPAVVGQLTPWCPGDPEHDRRDDRHLRDRPCDRWARRGAALRHREQRAAARRFGCAARSRRTRRPAAAPAAQPPLARRQQRGRPRTARPGVGPLPGRRHPGPGRDRLDAGVVPRPGVDLRAPLAALSSGGRRRARRRRHQRARADRQAGSGRRVPLARAGGDRLARGRDGRRRCPVQPPGAGRRGVGRRSSWGRPPGCASRSTRCSCAASRRH